MNWHIDDKDVQNYLKACGLKAHYGQTTCIAQDGKIIHMGHEPTVSLIKSILDLQQQITELQEQLNDNR